MSFLTQFLRNAPPSTPPVGQATTYFDANSRYSHIDATALVVVLVGRQTTDTFTNKTFDTAGAGNVLKVNGVTLTAVVGTGAVVLATSPALVTPNIGVAAGTSLVLTGLLTSSSPSAGIGYAAGAGAAVTQLTNRTTGVTINAITGAITTNNASLAAGAEAAFTVTNSSVAIGDVVVLSARSGQTAATSIPFVTAVAAGSFQITLSNFNAATADTGAMIINFAVIKAVSA